MQVDPTPAVDWFQRNYRLLDGDVTIRDGKVYLRSFVADLDDVIATNCAPLSDIFAEEIENAGSCREDLDAIEKVLRGVISECHELLEQVGRSRGGSSRGDVERLEATLGTEWSPPDPETGERTKTYDLAIVGRKVYKRPPEGWATGGGVDPKPAIEAAEELRRALGEIQSSSARAIDACARHDPRREA